MMRRPNGLARRRDRLPDSAEPDDAERQLAQRRHGAAQDLLRVIGPVDPGAFVQVFIGFDDAPVERQNERHGVIGDFVGAIVGAVADDDAVIGGGFEVDMVDADRHAGDDLALVELLDDGAGNRFS